MSWCELLSTLYILLSKQNFNNDTKKNRYKKKTLKKKYKNTKYLLKNLNAFLRVIHQINTSKRGRTCEWVHFERNCKNYSNNNTKKYELTE